MAVEDAATEELSFDVDAAIHAFVNDSSLASLELPRFLTAEQRKQAKKLADQHDGLKCESFGFGADRRLNLFKQGGMGLGCEGRLSDAVKSAVRVKNTFIDDFVGAEGGHPNSEPLHCRSLPNRLNNQPVWDCDGSSEGSTSAAEKLLLVAAACGSCGGSGPTSAGTLSRDSTPTSKRDFPEVPAGFKFTVRDTFIHIEEEPEVERITQSMPDGVFLRAMQAELSTRRRAAAAPANAAGPKVGYQAAPGARALEEPEPQVLAVGTEVTIEGLLKLPVFNGLAGTIDSYDPDTGRFNVLLDAPSAGSRWAKVKGENLRPRVPPPPHHAPTVASVDEEAAPIVPPTPTWEAPPCEQDMTLGLMLTTVPR